MPYQRTTGIRSTDLWSKHSRKSFEDAFGVNEFSRRWTECIDDTIEYVRVHKGDMCSDRLPQIQCPTLLVHGSDDPLVPAETQQMLLEKIANAELYQIPGGKHNVHIQKSDVFNRVVAEFLQHQMKIPISLSSDNV